MIMSEKQTAAVERKQRICDRYKGADTAEVEVIPAKPTEALEGKNTILRVAAYVRVSTDNDEQLTSYELQKNYYTDYISSHPGWVLAGIYADEGISGTSLEHRKGMQQMIEDWSSGTMPGTGTFCGRLRNLRNTTSSWQRTCAGCCMKRKELWKGG